MSRSKFWSVSQSTARVVFATTAVVTLAVIGACSEGGVAGNATAPSSLEHFSNTSSGLANAGVAQICVGASSPNGTYTFSATSFSQGAGGTTTNPAGNPFTINKITNTPTCVDVLSRTSVTVPDPMSSVFVQNTGAPGLAAFASADCVIDNGDFADPACNLDFSNPAADPFLGTATVNGLTVYANKFHGSKTTFNFSLPAAPQFVVGDLATGLPQAFAAINGNKPVPANTVNFWGSQWWKNNPMTLYKSNGWPSFKGYATTAGTCGETWTSRVGNSPPPPATINEYIDVIVTSNVWKAGPDISGNIKAIVRVHQDGGYGPNPGHDGNGPVTEILCGSI